MTFVATLPPVSNEELAGDRLSCELLIEGSLHWFTGHFPQQAILPAVVQIGWVVHFANKLGLSAASFAGIKRAKFSAIIQPGMQVSLQLVRRQQLLDFRIAADEQIFASGVLSYGD